MRQGIEYSADELIELSRLHDRTKEAAEQLEESFMDILEELKLTEKEVLFTLARVTDSFIRMHEDYNFNPDNRLDAEAAFNDYLIACRDITFGDDDNGDFEEDDPRGS